MTLSTKKTEQKKTVFEGISFPQIEDLDLNITAVGMAPWSYSKMSMLKKCPFQFYLKYLLKAKNVVSPKIFVRDVGKAAHRIIEFIIMGKSVEKAFKLTKEEYTKDLTPEEWAEGVETLEMSMLSFKERLDKFNENYNVKRVFQEIQVAVTKDWEPTGFWSDDCFFRGVIDLCLLIEPEGHTAGALLDAMFIDHKTGAPASMGIRNFTPQLDSYKVLFHFGIEKLLGATSGVHFIRDGEIKIGDYSTQDNIETTLKGSLEFTLESVIEITRERGFFKHVAGGHCKYCEYSDACKGKKLVDMEKDSKKWFEIKVEKVSPSSA